MNLSKVYSTQESFQPENIVRARLNEPPVFGSSIISSAFSERSRREQGFTRQPPLTPEPPSPPARTAQPQTADAAESVQEQNNQALTREVAQQSDPLPPEPPLKKDKQAIVPPPPAGIAPEEVEKRVAEAYARGLAEGQQLAEQDFGAAAASLQLICQQLDTLRETILQNSIGEIQDMVIAIAEKIIRHSVREQSQTIVDTVEEAIQKAVKSGEFYIYVNPDDHEIISAKAKELVAGVNGLNNIIIKKDPSIERGGCRLESDNCTVDATIAGQLAIIDDHLQHQ